MNIWNQEWQCTSCDWHGHEDDLESKLEFCGNREEPPEYSGWCPDCGASWEQMDEYDPGNAIDGAEYMLADR